MVNALEVSILIPQLPASCSSHPTAINDSSMKFSSLCATNLGYLVLLLTSPFSLAQAQCSDVHIVFARGSGEMPGLGICGEPLVSGITSNLGGMSVSSYAVNYLASYDQTSAGPGATDMANQVVSVAQQCPNTVFVLGGYSQGGSVTDIALGIKTMLGTGQSIPDTLAPRIKAIVTFGNPLKLMGQTIESSSSTYGPKAIEFCNMGDPVCGGGFNMMAHLMYSTDGSVTTAAQKAAALVQPGRCVAELKLNVARRLSVLSSVVCENLTLKMKTYYHDVLYKTCLICSLVLLR